MSANSVYRVVIDDKPDEPSNLDKWIAYSKRHQYEMGIYFGDGEDDKTIALDRWLTWRGGEQLRYFSIASARCHVSRLARHGVTAHVEGGRIEWVTA